MRSLLQTAVHVLLLASCAAAQCSVSGTTTIGISASNLSPCATFSGSITLATDAPDTVDFGDPGTVEGDLVVANAMKLVTLRANTLSSITGMFTMQNTSSLSMVQMQQLRNVGHEGQGGLQWSGLPLLQQLDFGVGISTLASLSIQDTQTKDLDAIAPVTATVIKVANNPSLNALNWPIQQCENLTISGNGLSDNGINVTLDDLETVGFITIRNASSLSLEMLAETSGALSIESTPAQYLGFPNLNSTRSISISNNEALSHLSFAALANVHGSLRLTDNNLLAGRQSFPALKQVNGLLNITGTLSDVQMPVIHSIAGDVYLSSTKDISQTCNRLASTLGVPLDADQLTCFSESKLLTLDSNAGVVDSNRSNTGDSAPSSVAAVSHNRGHLSGGQVGGVVVGAIAASACIVVAGSWLMRRFRARSQPGFARKTGSWLKPELSAQEKPWLEIEGREIAELPTVVERPELPGITPTAELSEHTVRSVELPTQSTSQSEVAGRCDRRNIAKSVARDAS